MRTTARRFVALALLLAAIVVLLWSCTDAFDRDEPSDGINVFGPWIGAEAEAFSAVLDDFTDETGITVRYTGSSDFEGDLRRRRGGGLGLPDVAVVPQPALFAELAARGVLVPFADETIESIVEHFPFTREQLTIDGEVFLAPYRSNVKSLVWYRPEVFADQGWEIPATLDDLGEFSDELSGGDSAPWCFAMEAGAVTGWAATDWVEDIHNLPPQITT